MKKPNIPTVLIIFGATGDLMAKKIVPALFHLFIKKKLPALFKVIGFSRRDITLDDFSTLLTQILTEHEGEILEKKDVDEFLKLFLYHKGDFETPSSYHTLAEILGYTDKMWRVCSNKLFYLAVPPQYYETIFAHLAESGLTIPCGPDEGWTRVIVEKPFGKNLATAEKLDELLGKLFREEQIYRIDHYLAKEMLQNILSFRFVNNLLEEVWNNRFIEQVHIRLLEDIGVEGRGVFYDGIGALRDVGQNHLLQMLSLVCMDQPKSLQAEFVRPKRAEILKTLKIPTTHEIAKTSFRAQYKGYRDIVGVSPTSSTETYFRVSAFLSSPIWQGVPFILESGKRVVRKKEIVVTFKHPTPCLCPPRTKTHYKNRVIFSLEPKEGITIEFWSKQPGLEFKMEKRTLNFLMRRTNKKTQYVEEYEKLLLDCIEGNQLLFLSTEEVRAMWAFTDPILEAWRKNVVPLSFYAPNTQEVLSQSAHVEQIITASHLPKVIGVVGLGKMGSNVARRLLEKGWRVVGFNRTSSDTKLLAQEGLTPAFTLEELVEQLSRPVPDGTGHSRKARPERSRRVVWLMLPAGDVIDEILFGKNGLAHILKKGDVVLDAGNSYYKDSIRRHKRLSRRGVDFVDVGFSGGPSGARYGGCFMVGGKQGTYEYLLPLFLDLATTRGVQFFEGVGAGHFVKMIHNGIEYGMMQAIAEGFTILKHAPYKLNLRNVAQVYNHGSVIESRLVGWLASALEVFGEHLTHVSAVVEHTGEGEWTVATAQKLKVKTRVIEQALRFRIESDKNARVPLAQQDYTAKILSSLRAMFGGHKTT